MIDNIEKVTKPTKPGRKSARIQIDLPASVSLACEAVANETGEKVGEIRELVRAEALSRLADLSPRDVYVAHQRAKLAKLEKG